MAVDAIEWIGMDGAVNHYCLGCHETEIPMGNPIKVMRLVKVAELDGTPNCHGCHQDLRKLTRLRIAPRTISLDESGRPRPSPNR